MRTTGPRGAAFLVLVAVLVGAADAQARSPGGAPAAQARAPIASRAAAAPRVGIHMGRGPAMSAFRGRSSGHFAARSVSRPAFHANRFAGRSPSIAGRSHPRTASRASRFAGRSLARTVHRHRVPAVVRAAHGRDAAIPRGRPYAPAVAQPTTRDHLAGPAYHRHGYPGGFIGWSGRVFWPYAYDDIFDYTFWPYDYDQTFWAYAYADVYNSIIWPYGRDDAVGSVGVPGGPPRLTHSRQTSPESAGACGDRTPGLTDWPIERIERTVRPTQAQRAALDGLKDASAQAMKVLQAACPPERAATPLARLDVMEKRLETMLRAIDIVRLAAETFYNALSNDQKARFDAIGRPGAPAQRDARLGDTAQFCSGKQGPALSEGSIRRIEQTVRPTDAQRGALDDLKDASARAIEMLQSACPRGIPATPLARLDAMERRLGAMLQAVRTVRPAMANFYGLLGEEQKARFNAIGSREG